MTLAEVDLMLYRMNEATFELPDEMHDRSVNVFTSVESGPSPFNIVFTRDRVEPGTDLSHHVTSEIDLLQQTLNNFNLIYRLEHLVDERTVEITGATFDSEAGRIQQRQVFLVDGTRAVTITASSAQDFAPDQLEALNHLIQTFRFES